MSVIGIICGILAICVGAYAAHCDVKTMTIPNMCSVAVFVLWLAAWASGLPSAGPFKVHLIVGLSVFIVSALFYVFKIWGGGDSKLAAAYGFWFTPHQAVIFLFVMAVLGGVLALVSIMIKRRINNGLSAEHFGKEHWFSRLLDGNSVIPYGVAIFGAAVYVIIPALIR